jgi:hypothetical protein
VAARLSIAFVLACLVACGCEQTSAARHIAARDADIAEIARRRAILDQRPRDHEALAKLASRQWAIGAYDEAQRRFDQALEMTNERSTAAGIRSTTL